MAHYGDPEAHRCILDEVAARPNAARLLAYFRAAVMGSQGSEVGVQHLRRFPGAVEQPGPYLKVTMALLSMTILASAAKPAFRQEQQRVYELLARERAALVQQGKQLRANRSASSSPLLWGAMSGASNMPVNSFSSDVNSVAAGAIAAAGVGASSGLSSNAHGSVLHPSGSVDEAPEDALTPQQWLEQAMDILNYGEAYANYLSGFTVLWYELFGPHYYYENEASRTGMLDDSEAAAEQEEGRPAVPAESGEWASHSSPASPAPSSPLRGPQVPPHLYAVRWREILTPQRRAWFQGLHNVVKELLVRLLTRELPLELYALFIQYANLSLRVYLLQTLAEVFEWTSNYLDVLYYVHVMRQSYSIQCEMSQLQQIWAAFGLFDNRFIDDCREFNKMYTESQGAFSEQQVRESSNTGTHGKSEALGGVGRNASHLESPAVGSGSGGGGGPATGPNAHDRASSRSATGTAASLFAFSSASAGSDGRRSAGAISSARAQDSSAAAPAPAAADVSGSDAGDAMHRLFLLRGTVATASSDAADAAHSSGSTSPEDEALSSASEAAADADTRTTKRAVYLPLFYTCCCFTWILQRSFWSMYGRCSLLLESCLGNEVAPQVLRVGAGGGGESKDGALFTATSLGARRRGTAAAGLNGATAAPNPRTLSTTSSTRSLHTATAANTQGGSGSGNMEKRTSFTQASTPAAGAAAAPQARETRDASGASPSGLNTAQNGGAGRPPQVPRGAQTQPQVQQQQQQQQQPLSQVQQAQQARRQTSLASPPPASSAEGVDASDATLAGASTASAVRGRSANGSSAAPASPVASEGQRGVSSPTRWAALLLQRLAAKRHAHGSTQPPVTTSTSTNAKPAQAAAAAAAAAGSSPVSEETAMTAATPVVAAMPAESEMLAASAAVVNSGAPFHLQYPHRLREIQLFEDPSGSASGGGGDSGADALFFEEFHFLRETGCYVLSHALRNLTCYPRFPATLLIFTDNTRRPGRVAWCDHKFSVLSSSMEDRDERRGLTPWVLSAVIPHTRLSSDGALRAQQEERLLQHLVFQVAGAKSSRVRFCTSNSVFFVLNGDREMDGGRLYFALHLHVPNSVGEGGAVSPDRVMREESSWAFRELGELHCSWAMACTCNEALRVAFQVGPVDDQTVEI